jgi:hypothetical protein
MSYFYYDFYMLLNNEWDVRERSFCVKINNLTQNTKVSKRKQLQ